MLKSIHSGCSSFKGCRFPGLLFTSSARAPSSLPEVPSQASAGPRSTRVATQQSKTVPERAAYLHNAHIVVQVLHAVVAALGLKGLPSEEHACNVGAIQGHHMQRGVVLERLEVWQLGFYGEIEASQHYPLHIKTSKLPLACSYKSSMSLGRSCYLTLWRRTCMLPATSYQNLFTLECHCIGKPSE